MRHFGKRAFALLLALMLCLSLFPSALAEDAGSIAAEDAPEQEITIAPEEEGDIIPAEEGTIAPADEGSIRPAEEGDALPRTDETQDGETSGQCGNDLTWSFDEATGALSITGSGDMWDWSYYSAPRAPWFSLGGSIQSVKLPRGLTSIGNYAFHYCSKLTSVDIPAGVTSIGSSAFSRCSGLTSVEIPNTVRLIDESAFQGCSGLTSVVIPGSVQTIGSYAFSDCGALTSVVIREGTESIMDHAFAYCSELSSVTLPGSLTYLGSSALPFNNLQELYFGGTVEAWKALQVPYDRTRVTVHCADADFLAAAEQCGNDLTWSFDEASGTLTVTGSGDMWDWRSSSYVPWDSLRASIKSVELPQRMTSIGWCAFAYCSGLTVVTIPEGVVSIGVAAFQGCSGLAELTVPAGVTSIGNYAFSGCSGLSSIAIPASATVIGTYVFSGCENLKDVYYAGTCEVWRGLNLSYDRGSVTVHCADGTIEAHSAGDRQCGDDLFWSLENGILTISGTGDMWNYECYYDSSASTQLSTSPWYAQRDTITQIRLTEGVTGIGNYAFSTYTTYGGSTFCNNLVSVELPETLQRIGASGFGGCSALKEIRLPDSLREIGGSALARCGFTELALPEGLETIGSNAFFGAMIRSLTVPASVTEIGSDAFGYSSLSEIRFLGDAPAVDGAAFHGITATAYYPQNNPTWTESVKRSYGGVITWEPYLPTGGTLRLSDATACAGKAFTLDLSLEENPGIMGLSFQLDYDSAVMEFVGAEEGVLTGWTVNVRKNALVWDSDREHTESGILLRLKFRLKEDAAPGETRIGLANFKAVNFDESSLMFQIRSAQVTVLVHRPGDANGDGRVDIADLVRLRKYLAGAETEIIAGNADVNADDLVDILDLVRMRKYLALDDVILE